jgi:WD40-like Beta Propeller Repeat
MALSALPPGRATPASAACALALALCLGCEGELVNLGSSELHQGGAAGTSNSGGSASVEQVWALAATPLLPTVPGLLLANPTLKADLSELYYSVQSRAGADPPLTHVERANGIDLGARGPVTFAGVTPDTDLVSPAVSEDATELWLGINTQWLATGALSGNTDIYRSQRQGDSWSTPTLIESLSDPDFDDVPRPPAVNGTIMPLSSKRHGALPSYYQIYLATRTSSDADAAWGAPSNALLGAVNSEAFQSADAFLSADGLELYFSSTRAGEHLHSDLYVARRASLEAAFEAPALLVDLDDPASDERMPWVSPGGDKLYFASNRSGQFELYLATKL